ncbi:MAG: acyl carrier protein [Rhodospirillaceae bacterium]|nr:acyl carrier protein [Rhodospirillaceae bacterium]
MSSTQERLKQLVDENLDLGGNPDFDARLADAGVSSVDAVAFFREVNQTFNLSLKPEDCLQFKTLRLLEEYIDARAG